MSKTPEFIETIADAIDGTVLEVGIHPDGESGFATMSSPLPSDHWLYVTDQEGYTPRAHYPMLAGRESMARDFLGKMIVEHGGKHGVKSATSNGRDMDFDPDALVRNVELGLFGLWTDNGLTGNPDDAKLFDPIQPGNLGKVLLEAVGLAVLDGLITAEDVAKATTPESLEGYRKAHQERIEERHRAYEEYRISKGWDKLDVCYTEGAPQETENDFRSSIAHLADLDIAATYPKPYWPGLQTVYDDDASVLNALTNKHIAADLERQVREAFLNVSNQSLTSEQLAARCESVLRNAFSDVVADVDISTSVDGDVTTKGYSYKCTIKLPDTPENRRLLGVPDNAPAEQTFAAEFHRASDQ